MIGFYDSGLGGMTILKEMVELSAATGLMYYGDTKNVPLGDKTEEEIHSAVEQGVRFLFEKGCNIVVLACNTATVTSVRKLQQEDWLAQYPGCNALGVVRPVSEALIEMEVSKESTIAVMATKATIDSQFYQEELRTSGYSNIVDIACVGLALAIEQQDLDMQRSLLKEYFNTLDITSINYIVLACTHYPIIQDIIKEEFINAGGSKKVKIISQSEVVPEKLIDYLIRHKEYELTGQGVSIFVTAGADEFEQKVDKLFDIKTKVELV
jgi:glutamate racemase